MSVEKYFFKEFQHQISSHKDSITNKKLSETIPENVQEACVRYGEVRKACSNLLQ